MAENQVILCVNPKASIPALTKGWLVLDRDRIAATLRERGKRVEVVRPVDLVAKDDRFFESSVVFSATSIFPRCRLGLEAALVLAQQRGAAPLPDLLHYLCFENKVVGSVLAHARGCAIPRYAVVQCKKDIPRALEHCGLPSVWKLPDGAGSRNVRLVKNPDDAQRLARRWLDEPNWGANESPSFLDRLRNRLFGKYGGRGAGAVLVQEFLTSPGYDWKVLVWNEKANALKRNNRKNDFRASGSGLFTVESCPPEVLDAAMDTCRRLGLLWGSVDVVETAEGPKVVEWQAVHFGTLTTEMADHHYRSDGTEWCRVEEPISMEREIAAALAARSDELTRGEEKPSVGRAA